MTSSASVLVSVRPGRCCSLHFRMPMSPSWLPRFALAQLFLAQLPSLAGSPLATYRCSVLVLLRRSCWVCSQLCAPASPRLPLHWRAFAFQPDTPSSYGCSECSKVVLLPRRCCLRLYLFCICSPLGVGALWSMCLGLAWCPSVSFTFMSICALVYPALASLLASRAIIFSNCEKPVIKPSASG